MKAFVGVLAMLAILAAGVAAATDKVVCYYGSWSVYRPGSGKFAVESINPQLCTHLIYTFVGLKASGEVRIMDEWNEIGNSGFVKFNNLRQQNPKLKTLIAIGGWNEGSIMYSNVVANPTTRAAFVNSIVSFTKEHNFDGFDLDWEYPAQREGAPADKGNYILLLQELRSRFDQEGLLLTAAVGATEAFIQSSYDVPQMSKYLDFINVMSYDLHGSWDGATGQNSPLYKSSKDTGNNLKLNVESSIQAWLDAGAAPSKIVLGVGVYGRSFTLANAANAGIGAATTGGGTAGPYTRESGYLGYNEICEFHKTNTWSVTWDTEQQVPYMSKGNQWVGYDDVRSVTAKAEFAKSKNLGGVMIWSIETDDFAGICGSKYPILKALNGVIFGNGHEIELPVETDAPIISPTVAPTSAPITEPPATGDEFSCPGVGLYRDPKDCNVYYNCGASLKPYKNKCPAELYFDPSIQGCNYQSAVSCP